MNIKKIPVEKAVGTRLSHDITEIRPGEFKGAAFTRGHEVCHEDICLLQRLGKNHLYLLELGEDEIHEDEAAELLAHALAGEGVEWVQRPREGKINLLAARDGLLKVDRAALASFNMIDEVMCATLHDNTLVRRGQRVAATRMIPLVAQRVAVERAAAIGGLRGGVLKVIPLRSAIVGLIITGNEVFNGLIQDRFRPLMEQKLKEFNCTLRAVRVVPDEPQAIAAAVKEQLASGCNLLLMTGGMSVDPDDVTREGIRMAGATELHYGASVLPGAMFLVAYMNGVPLLGVPACGLYHRITVLDLVLPRILAGEHITKRDLAFLGHGGLCQDCPECSYPHCPFGKGG